MLTLVSSGPIRCRLFERIEPFADDMWRAVDDGTLFHFDDLPVGAMWFADWLMERHPEWAGPDGHYLCVKTPSGLWYPDKPARDGTPWTRTGVAPRITASPSILFYGAGGRHEYHGWLREGSLIPCLPAQTPGKLFPLGR